MLFLLISIFFKFLPTKTPKNDAKNNINAEYLLKHDDLAKNSFDLMDKASNFKESSSYSNTKLDYNSLNKESWMSKPIENRNVNLYSAPNEFNSDFKITSLSTNTDISDNQNHVCIKNCNFRKNSAINSASNSLYIITNAHKSNQNAPIIKEDIIEIKIENNYFDTCSGTDFINIINSTTAIIINNTFDLSQSATFCGAFYILKSGNITITDCHFIGIKKSGFIYYEPESEGSENDFLLIEDCSFESCIGVCCIFNVKTNSLETIKFSNCTFNECHKGTDNSIAFSVSETADSITLSVINCSFTNCEKNSSNSYVINLMINQLKNEGSIFFIDNVFDSSCGAIQIIQQDGNVIIDNCIFNNLNQNPISFELLSELSIKKCKFISCNGIVEIKSNIFNADISDSIFTDFYSSGSEISAIIVSNKQCILNNNIVNFTSNENDKSIPALIISNHGNIEVTNNKFLNFRGSSSTISGITIREENNDIDQSFAKIVFNYNTIENAGNIHLGIFNIEKINFFEFDHNIIKDCKMDRYSASIILKEGNVFSNFLTITNLSLINCSANCLTGGGFGLWLVFGNTRVGTFKLENCNFYGNKIGIDGCGGAFESGNSTTAKTEFIAQNCNFTENHALNCGGALSIQSTLHAAIVNCTFINNEAGKGGGAIYIYPNNEFRFNGESLGQLPSCTISSCIFESNKDTSNNGHAIFFKFKKGCSTKLQIINCNFTDNGVNESDSGQGFSISSDAPFLTIENISVNFSESEHSTTALRVNENTDILTINRCEINKVKGNPACIISCNSSIINNFTVISEETEVCIKILNLNHLNVTDSIFQNNGIAIQIDDKYLPSISDLYFYFFSCFSTNSLLSYSSLANNHLEIDCINFLSCASSLGSFVDIQNVDYVSISNLLIKNCHGKLFSISSEILFLDSCTFESNYFRTEGCLLINTQNIATIKNCSFLNNDNIMAELKYGGICVVSNDTYSPEVTIIDSVFLNIRNFKKANSILVEGNTARIIIKNTQFTDSTNLDINSIVLETSNLEISDVTFTCSKTISFSNLESIHDILFKNVTSNTAPLLTISSENTYSLDNVSFYNCIANRYVIQADTNQFKIYNSVIEFDEAIDGKSCRGIDIRTNGNHEIMNTKFIKTIIRGINYGIYDNTFKEEIITISDCLFDGCSGENNDRVITINIPHKLVFQNNIIQNTQQSLYSIVINLYCIDEFTLDSCKFINNSMISPISEDYSGGSGIWVCRGERTQYYRQLIKVYYTNCQWINNSVDKPSGGGALQVGRNSLSNIELTFSKCNFVDNNAINGNGGALTIQTVQPLTINECVFLNNKVSSIDGLGGALFIDPNFERRGREYMRNCDIVNCTFEGNKASANNGHAIYMTGELDTLLSIYSNNTFKDNYNENGGGSSILYNGQNIYLESLQFSESKKSRFIEFGENSEVSINNVHFSNYYEKDGDGNAIKIDSNSTSCSLLDCIFTNCGSKGFVIKNLGGTVTFDNCSFIFDGDTACCALDIETDEKAEVRNCCFVRNNNANEESLKSGTLFYHPQNPKQQLIITSCSFVECTGNLYKTFSIQTPIEPEFSFITVNNTGTLENPTGYIGEISLQGVESFTPKSLNINNIIASSQFGGGGGILINSDTTLDLTFQSCEWTNNHAVYSQDFGNRYNGIGGAFQRGFSDSQSNTALTFDNCKFMDNKSDRQGGALAIQTILTATISNCIFRGNKAGVGQISPLFLLEESFKFGGAVYIDPDFSENSESPRIPSINIQQSQFIDNEAVNGHAIYIQGAIKTSFNIQENNVFTDNGIGGATIYTECSDFNIDSTTVFNFTESTKSSRPYDFGTGATATYENLVFENICSAENEYEGNVILLVEGVKMPTISNCTFKNCGLTGYVIVINSTETITFINNTIIFDDHQKSCKGLGIFSQARMIIKDSYFKRCNNYKETDAGGGINIVPPDQNMQNYNSLEIINVTFDEMHGRSQCSFFIRWWDTYIKCEKLSIINSPLSSYTGTIYFIDNNSFNFELIDCLFYNNTSSSEFSGGCGLFISAATNKTSILRFKNCNWTYNQVGYNGNGGAFQAAFSKINENTLISFDGCAFYDNRADNNGGALAIRTKEDCTINNCSFINNKASLYTYTGSGGAIFINPEVTRSNISIIIEDCFFEGNTARDGHSLALYSEILVNVLNNNFTNNGGNSGSALYSNCYYIRIRDNYFTYNYMSRAIELNLTNQNEIVNNVFNKLKSSENGGAILLSSAVEHSECMIEKCQFIHCSSMENGGSLFISNVERVSILDTVFDDGNTFEGEGVAIFLSSDANYIDFSNVSFINQQCSSRFLISTSCMTFDIHDMIIENQNFGSGIKGIQANDGIVSIKNMTFDKCISGIEINSEVKESTIEDCIFTDVYYIRGNVPTGQVVLISNYKCIFTRNVINFTSKDRAITGLCVISHGDIEISHNKFIKIRNSNKSGILIEDTKSNSSEGLVRFNYNLIEDVFNSKFGIFYISKFNEFNFDHNIIKNCKISDYTSHFILRDSICFYDHFTLLNLTLSGCEASDCLTGGGFGVWIQFKDRKGKFDFIDCNFENNIAGERNNGGAFGSGNSSTADIELLFDGCLFNGNSALNCGGALSLQSTQPAFIINCSFTNNEAKKGGGAIYIYPFRSLTKMMPNCTISRCNFSRNKDISNNGHAIFFKEFSQAETILTIEENCQFIDNGSFDDKKYQGYSIVAMAPSLDFKDSKIEFSGLFNVASALKIGSSNSILTNIHFVNVKTYQQDGYVGMALFINSSTLSVKVYNCVFEKFGTVGEEQENQTNGNAIFIENKNQSVLIQDCQFVDCARQGSVIYSEGGILFDETNQDNIESLTISSCSFVNNEKSSGLAMNVTGSFNDINIKECLFKGNSETSDSCIYISCYPKLFTFIDNIFSNFNLYETSNFMIYMNMNDQIENIELKNNTFLNNTNKNSNFGGIGLHFEGINEIIINECQFHNNEAIRTSNTNNEYSGYGGGLEIGSLNSKENISIRLENCKFKSNKATKHGGGLSIENTGTIIIHNCIFEENIANYHPTSSTDTILNGDEGKGGSIFIDTSCTYMATSKSTDESHFIKIETCEFINNEGYDGHAIYLSGEAKTITKIEIERNDFINNFSSQTQDHNSSIVLTEYCLFTIDDLLLTNNFTNNDETVEILSSDCLQMSSEIFKPTNEFTNSQLFTSSFEFSPTRAFTVSDAFSISEIFTESQTIFIDLPETFTVSDAFSISEFFTESQTIFIDLPETKVTRKMTFSKSYSLTYVNRRSVSYSLSYFVSNTYEFQFDSNQGTYTMIARETQYQGYFPYIIFYLSPLYVERAVTIDITPKRKITPEQLIGVACGSASVFFLVLGITILAVRKHNELKNQYDEFDDLSYSEPNENVILLKEKETENININTQSEEANVDISSGDFLDFWA